MKAMRDMRLGTRLALGFGFVLLLLVGVSGVGVLSMTRIQDRLQEIATVNNQQARLAVAMRLAVHEIAARSRDLVLYDGLRKRNAGTGVAEARRSYDSAEQALDAMLADEDVAEPMRKMLATLKALKAETLPHVAKVVELGLGDLSDEAARYQGTEVDGRMKKWLEALGALADSKDQASVEAAENAQSAYDRALTLMIVLCAAGVALGIVTAWLITRSVTGPLADAVRVAQTVSDGDLTSRIEARGKDETGTLLSALQQMNANLVDVVTTVRDSSDSIATGVGEIATGNQDLSRRTEQQATHLQQTVASMAQVGATVESTAATARQAASLAGTAAAAAIKGGEAVDQVVTTMEAIAGSSRKVSEIIGVIDGIAFQTNILALNAAVEAARAGEQGRGFAVVASEVRSLAGRSAQAAREIKELIGESVERIQTGANQVEAAGGTMKDIVTQIRRVSDLVSEISAAASEQTAGMAQIHQAVTQLDEATQQNAALVEQSAAAADNLNTQAARLVDAVGSFKLSDGHAVAQRHGRPAVGSPTRAALTYA